MNLTLRYMATRLLIPLMVGAALLFSTAFACPEPWKSLLVNLAAAMVGSVITVFFVDAVLKRQRQVEWESVRIRTNNRLTKVGYAGIGSVRLALQISIWDIFDSRFAIQPAEMYSESIKMAETLLPCQINNLKNLDEAGWRTLIVNLTNLINLCDQLLTLFGRDLEAEITRLLLDIQTAAEASSIQYSTFPDLLGVPDSRLPRKRDGSSTVPTRDGATQQAGKELIRLCGLCADLLRKLPPVAKE